MTAIEAAYVKRPMVPRKPRETPTERAKRQLRESGFAIPYDVPYLRNVVPYPPRGGSKGGGGFFPRWGPQKIRAEISTERFEGSGGRGRADTVARVKRALKPRHVVLETSERVGYDGVYYVIVPDHAAGRPRRFTVYRVPASPSRRVRVVGQELPIGDCRRLVGRLEKKIARSRPRGL